MITDVSMQGLVIEVNVYPAAPIDGIAGLPQALKDRYQRMSVETINDAREIAAEDQPAIIRIANGPDGDVCHALYDSHTPNVLRQIITAPL